MSIMSDTYIVKTDGKYTAFRAGNFAFPNDYIDAAKQEPCNVFDLFQKMRKPKYKSWWGEPIEVADEAAVNEIANADHSIDDGKPGYSKCAGDTVYMIDDDREMVSFWARNKSQWERMG